MPCGTVELLDGGAVQTHCIVCGIAWTGHVLTSRALLSAWTAHSVGVVCALGCHVCVRGAVPREKGADAALAVHEGSAVAGQIHAHRTLFYDRTFCAVPVGIVLAGGGLVGDTVPTRRIALHAVVVGDVGTCVSNRM